jgi:hypothetical protein
MEINEKTFIEAIPLSLILNELHLLYRTQRPKYSQANVGSVPP